MANLFPPDAVIRKVDAEAVLLLGGGRALLMQLAHPLVAAGVAEHSDFAADPFGRLRRTLEASYGIVFGTEDEARAVSARLSAIHDTVTGPGYQANDPELLLWVHATLVDTAMRVHARFLRPLSEDESREYYDESATVAEILGIPRGLQPPDVEAFRDYVRTMVGSLEVTDTARALARAVLHPRRPWIAEPAFLAARQLTIGLLPAPLRLQYGFGWDERRGAALDVVSAASRRLLSRVPSGLRRVPTTLVA